MVSAQFTMQVALEQNEEPCDDPHVRLARISEQYAHPQDLLRDAGIAMYRAKGPGKRCSVDFEAELRTAIEREEFRLYYQPIVSSITHAIIGVKGLVRWQHPQRGWIASSEFVDAAEETGLIVPLGAWILRAACIQLAAWRDAGLPSIYVAVNLSARQLRGGGLSIMIERTLQEFEIEPRRLSLELAESCIMEDVAASMMVLRQLRALGIQLAIDDFSRAPECDAMQGYLFSHPLPAAALSTLLGERRRFAASTPGLHLRQLSSPIG